MALIPYLQPGASLSAASWNAVFMAADAAMTSSLGGMSAVLAGNDKQWDRSFFFFNPITLPTNLHPVASHFFTYSVKYGPGSNNFLFCRQYSDAAIGGILSGLQNPAGHPPFAYSATTGVAVLNYAVWTTWFAAMYPLGVPGAGGNYYSAGIESRYTLDGNITYTNMPVINWLDLSLQSWNITISSTNYAVSFQDSTTAEHLQPWKPVDVFINSAFTWSSAWNKYSVVRVHNCANTSTNVNFGSVSQTLHPGASLCVRKLSTGSWTVCGNYFHWMESGDPRFLQVLETNGGSASCFHPGVVTDVLATVGAVNFGKYFNVAAFWDMSAIYNSGSYSPPSFDNPAPVGGYFPALNGSALLGDLLIPHGNLLLCYRPPLQSPEPPLGVYTPEFTGFASLGSVLAPSGAATRTMSQTFGSQTILNTEIYFGGTGALDLLDTQTALAWLTSSALAVTIGASQSSSPKSLVLPHFTFKCVGVVNAPVSTNYTFANFTVDGNGNNIAAGTNSTVTVVQAGSTQSVPTKYFTVTNTVSDVESWINSVVLGGVVGVQNYAVLSTPFGHALTWQEVWPVAPNFSGINILQYIASVVYDLTKTAFIVTRAAFLQDAAGVTGVFPPRSPSTSFLPWNYPRVDKRYAFQLTNIQPFSATSPISVDSVVTPVAFLEYDISRPGAFNGSGDIWPIMAVWLSGGGVFAGETVVANHVRGADFYWTNVSAVFANSVPLPWTTTWETCLPCQAEHINVVAGLINASPPRKWQPGQYGNASFTLNFPAGSIILINGGAGYSVNDPVNIPDFPDNPGSGTLNLKVGSVDGNGAIQSIVQNGSVVSLPYTAYTTPVRPFAVVSGTGAGATIDTSSSGGSPLSFIPTFNPVGVPVPVQTAANTIQYPVTRIGQAWSLISGTYWPRTTYFAWNGATPGGADPVAVYLGGLGMTVQTSLPDSYGASMLTSLVVQDGAGNVSSTGPGGTAPGYYAYAQGFDPSFAVTAATYRWVTIADARVLYASMSLPFVLSGTFAPVSFTSIVGAPSIAQVESNTDGPTGSVYTPTALYGPQPNYPAAGALGYNTIAAFYGNPNGAWLSLMSGSTMRSGLNKIVPAGPINDGLQPWEIEISSNVAVSGTYFDETDNLWHWSAATSWQFVFLDYGILNPQANPQYVPAAYTAVVVLAEGVSEQVVSVIPQNYSYPDPNSYSSLIRALADRSMGYGIIPIIADNSVEQSVVEATVISGVGGSTHYETVLETKLSNGRLVIQAVDGTQGTAPVVPGAGSGGAGAGGGSGSGGGGGGL